MAYKIVTKKRYASRHLTWKEVQGIIKQLELAGLSAKQILAMLKATN